MRPLRFARYYYLKFTRLQGDPKSLAMGTAIGVFIGVTPTIPLHTIIILLIVMVTRASAIAAILASWIVCNPLTYLPIYYFSMVIGNAATPYHLNWPRVKAVIDSLASHKGFLHSLQEVLSLGFEAVVVMVIGGILLAIPFTIVSYYSSLHLFKKIHHKRMRRKTSKNK